MASKTQDLGLAEKNNIVLEASIPKNLANCRLDKALAQLFPSYSRSQITRWIREKWVTVDHSVQAPRYKVQPDEHIYIAAPTVPQARWETAEDITLSIVYEDASIFVINKPPGLVVHPGNGNFSGTLVNGLLYYDPQLKQLPRAGLIHRLDKDTSGLLIIARNLESYHYLVQELQSHHIVRTYQAVVSGNFLGMRKIGVIKAPIGRHPKYRTRMTVFGEQNWSNSKGHHSKRKQAITHYEVIKNYDYHSLLKVTLETGRTHQIRAHMSYMGHPIVGDTIYGGPKNLAPLSSEVEINRQALHACQLTFRHPETHKKQTVEAPLPLDIKNVLDELSNISLNSRSK